MKRLVQGTPLLTCLIFPFDISQFCKREECETHTVEEECERKLKCLLVVTPALPPSCELGELFNFCANFALVKKK